MQGLDNILGGIASKIGGIFSGGGGGGGGTPPIVAGGGGGSPLWEKLLTGGMFGAGEIGNIIEERRRLAYQSYISDLLKHPEKLAAMAAKIQQPLSNALVQGVTNTVQGDLAQRGLAEAPGIFAATESQALAPYQLHNQDVAMNAVLQSLGLPAGTFQSPQNMSGALQAFLNTMKKPPAGGSASSTTPGFTFPTGTVGDLNPSTPPFIASGDTTTTPDIWNQG